MALLRFNIQGAVPPPANLAEQEWLDDLMVRLRILKSHCVIINEGELNEETITNFTYHLCHHDEGGVCEPEREI